mmetsp:Transcript_8678/g.16962  ORF Transcript_8678/g.16962 Transcript_8678/m.16962 type:complete len:200 (-) Transcript_8678:1137-1736(-)
MSPLKAQLKQAWDLQHESCLGNICKDRACESPDEFHISWAENYIVKAGLSDSTVLVLCKAADLPVDEFHDSGKNSLLNVVRDIHCARGLRLLLNQPAELFGAVVDVGGLAVAELQQELSYFFSSRGADLLYIGSNREGTGRDKCPTTHRGPRLPLVLLLLIKCGERGLGLMSVECRRWRAVRAYYFFPGSLMTWKSYPP